MIHILSVRRILKFYHNKSQSSWILNHCSFLKLEVDGKKTKTYVFQSGQFILDKMMLMMMITVIGEVQCEIEG